MGRFEEAEARHFGDDHTLGCGGLGCSGSVFIGIFILWVVLPGVIILIAQLLKGM